MKFITSKYFIEASKFYWVIAFLFIIKLFVVKYLPRDYIKVTEIILACSFFLSFFVLAFFITFRSYDIENIKHKIDKLNKDLTDQYSSITDIKKTKFLLLQYELILDLFSDIAPYIHVRKTKEQISDPSNIKNYFLILLIISIGQTSFSYLDSIGPVVHLFLISIASIFCIKMLLTEIINKKPLISTTNLLHAFSLYILFAWGKFSYIENYGVEIIGSYLEKNEYETKYYVNLFQDKDAIANYRLPASIFVYSETFDGMPEEDRFGIERSKSSKNRYIRLKCIYWPNGSYSNFYDCDLEIGEKVFCKTVNGESWYIELTNEKVK